MSNYVWVLYCEHNDYNQHGPTAEKFWRDEPSIALLNDLLKTDFPEHGTLDDYNGYLSNREVRERFGFDTYFVDREELE